MTGKINIIFMTGGSLQVGAGHPLKWGSSPLTEAGRRGHHLPDVYISKRWFPGP